MKALLAGVMLLLAAPEAFAMGQADLERAIRNYRAVIEGRQRLQDLTPAERAEVEEIDRRVRDGRPPRGTPEERCRERELNRSGGRPSALELELINLRCRD